MPLHPPVGLHVLDGVDPPRHHRRQRPGPGSLLARVRQPCTTSEARPVPVPRPGRPRLLPRLHRLRPHHGRAPAHRSRPRPLQQEPHRLHRRAIHPKRGSEPCGPPTTCVRTAAGSSTSTARNRANRPHVRGHGPRSRRRAHPHRLHRRTRHTRPRCLKLLASRAATTLNESGAESAAISPGGRPKP